MEDIIVPACTFLIGLVIGFVICVGCIANGYVPKDDIQQAIKINENITCKEYLESEK